MPLINFTVNDKIFVKDPHSSDLGRKILKASIDLIAELGFEAFTFRKLAKQIGSTEASVYRYFENKHRLLLYLTAWYWTWLEHRLMFGLANISSAEQRLEIAIKLLTEPIETDMAFDYINEQKLNRIIFDESSKCYLTKEVDSENKDGVFVAYKRVVEHVGSIVLEINSKYKYPHMLVSNMIEGAHLQRFFAQHLPRLTDSIKGEDAVTDFYNDLVFKSIGSKGKKK
jgi:AcrR family transcriptional regulator